MLFKQKIGELQKSIFDVLLPLIDNDYVLLDLPYFPNIGDVLIWQGTIDLLKNTKYKCLHSTSQQNYRPIQLDPKVVILLMGGGNMGDLWYHHQVFRKMIIESFPNNKIIQLPQSLFYKSQEVLEADASVYNKHNNLHLFFRDQYSVDLAKHFFNHATIGLLPDMAFCMDMNLWKNSYQVAPKDVLFVKRTDAEWNEGQSYQLVPTEAEVRDWPSMEYSYKKLDILFRIQRKCAKLDQRYSIHSNDFVMNLAYKYWVKNMLIEDGIKFLTSYKVIYTTRLHVAILAVLLEKDCVMFDNSYGKNKGLYQAFLSDVDGVSFAP